MFPRCRLIGGRCGGGCAASGDLNIRGPHDGDWVTYPTEDLDAVRRVHLVLAFTGGTPC